MEPLAPPVRRAVSGGESGLLTSFHEVKFITALARPTVILPLLAMNVAVVFLAAMRSFTLDGR